MNLGRDWLAGIAFGFCMAALYAVICSFFDD
jgi:hypothetical protein